jgi:DNA transformation protein
MPVSADFHAFALEQLGQVTPVTSRRMFGGVGFYADDLFFALADDDTLYFKVDDVTRGDYEAEGMAPFRPFGPESPPMGYWELPAGLLDSPEELAPWMTKALEVARRAASRKRKKGAGKKSRDRSGGRG